MKWLEELREVTQKTNIDCVVSKVSLLRLIEIAEMFCGDCDNYFPGCWEDEDTWEFTHDPACPYSDEWRVE